MILIMHILPELFISVLVMITLMMGVFIKKSFNLITLLTILSLILKKDKHMGLMSCGTIPFRDITL